MNLFFQETWEVEGLQTVGILLVVCSSLKLMHFLGLIDLSSPGTVPPPAQGQYPPGSPCKVSAKV